MRIILVYSKRSTNFKFFKIVFGTYQSNPFRKPYNHWHSAALQNHRIYHWKEMFELISRKMKLAEDILPRGGFEQLNIPVFIQAMQKNNEAPAKRRKKKSLIF